MHAKYSTLWIFWGLAGWKLRLRPLRFFYVQFKVSQTSDLIYVVIWAPRHDIAARCPSVYDTWQFQAAGLGSITIDDYDYDYMSFLFVDYDYDYSSW